MARFFVGLGQFGGTLLNPPFQLIMGLLQCLLGPFSLRDVLNGAKHGNRLPVFVELQSAKPMNPPHLLVPVADDPVLTVKGLLLSHDFLEEVIQHLLAFIGMQQICPSVNRPLIVGGNAKDPVENRRSCKTARGNIKDIEAQAGNFLSFQKSCLSFPNRLFSLSLGRDVGKDPQDSGNISMLIFDGGLDGADDEFLAIRRAVHFFDLFCAS